MASAVLSQSLFSNLTSSHPPIPKKNTANATPLSVSVNQSRRFSGSHVVSGQIMRSLKNLVVNSASSEDGSSREETPIELRYPAFPTVMDINKIREILPHRYPFLLVDRVIEYNPGVSAVAIKNVTINDDFFPGHFPDRPIMPGVLMVERLDYPPRPRTSHPTIVTRRSILLTTLITTSTSIILTTRSAAGLELRFTVPDQTLEEAENSAPVHAQSLLKVRDLLTAESWVEAQKALRKSSSYLKQDLYTIIQGRPAKDRPRLRKLYADLFNAVTRLDYAVRDKDGIRVWDCWRSIISSLDLFLSHT